MPSPSRLALAGFGLSLACGALCMRIGPAEAAPTTAAQRAQKPPRPSAEAILAHFDPRDQAREGDVLVSRLPSGYRAVLTLDPELNEVVRDVVRRYEVPFAGVAAVDPKSGQLLAYVSHSSAEPGKVDHVLDASPPAASVFKLITGSALLENGVNPSTTTCYHGGFSSLEASEIVDNPKLDSACVSLSSALGRSINSVFAKRAVQHLDRDTLARYGSAFGFGEALPFEKRPAPSQIDVPKQKLEFARTAAGFWHTNMSPLHAAMIAATIANHGKMMRPYIVDRLEDGEGRVVERGKPALHRAVLGRRTAELLGQMMQRTVTMGTARSAFFDAQGNAFLPGVSVAGKTGTLSKERPYRGYTWWVGFAPADKPKIAIAALVVNSPKWRIKASYVAREALRHYLVEKPRKATAGKIATK